MGIFTAIFGSKNSRELKKIRPVVDQINGLEPEWQKKSDADLAALTVKFKERIANGEKLDSVLPEAFATVREAGRRVLNMRHFDVQLIGGMILNKGTIAEMRTGEGKTLVSTLPAYLNALEGKGVHVVTVNDYLARRDSEWMGRLHNFLGLSCGVVVHGLTDQERQRAYRCDITYGQNNEFGFDYLRDNMKQSPDSLVQRELHYAIVDEVDSILIDEARTPLIISGPAEESADLYERVNAIVPSLKKDVDYNVDEKAHSAALTDNGVERLEKKLGLANLYDPNNIQWLHHVTQALRAHTLYKKDVNYLVQDGEILIIDEHTGRAMPGRRWSDGLHQAVEAKEGVEIKEENETLATISFQNYFRMYKKLCGMTGTADTEAEEFSKTYKLDVLVVPTNRPMVRKDLHDLVYKNEKGKFKAVLDEIEEFHKRGQPCLVGTISVEKSEILSTLLRQRKIPHNVLNAKQHEREASIVAQAGRKGAVTIATNMAGRGTDILLGGNAEAMAKSEFDPVTQPDEYKAALARYEVECKAEREEVRAAGGLHILGTERHEARRIDNQLRGRAARQGDPGSSHFYLSLEDELLRVFGAERIIGLMERLGMEEDTPIEHPWINKSIENAQRKVEGHNFDSRKHLLEYDDVMNQQRKTIYALRKQVLLGVYVPQLTEDEVKAGAKPPEAPIKSGKWTIDEVAKNVKPAVVRVLDGWWEIGADGPFREPGQPAPAATATVGEDGQPVEAAPPPEPPRREPRKLRTELYRNFGCYPDLDQLTEATASKPKLLDWTLDKVARSFIQQRERMMDVIEGLVEDKLDEFCPSRGHAEDWDLPALKVALKEQFNLDIDVELKLAEREREILGAKVWKQIETRIETKEIELGLIPFYYFSRFFMLEEIDGAWIEHLKSMDHLREGISLRGYGQKDPKQEYKKEGFEMFGQMLGRINGNVANKLFRLELASREDERERAIAEAKHKQRKMVATHADGGGGGDAKAEAKATAAPKAEVRGGSAVAITRTDSEGKVQTFQREQPKVGRNDPCPCGSGKKYKKCHGVNAEPRYDG